MFKPVQFGKYYLTERLAGGPAAELFKAKLDQSNGSSPPIVVKQILPRYAKSADFVRAFIDQAPTAVSLTHGNIVAVYELGRVDDVYFIAMEYVDGKNLAQISEDARIRPVILTIDHALHIAIEICKGLHYAHRHGRDNGRPAGVVHCGVHPANVMVSLDGEVKLADFGIANSTSVAGLSGTQAGEGARGYASPEQVSGGLADHRTDIFSCGILLHEMLTGQPLFARARPRDSLKLIERARVPPPSLINPRVTPALDAIVLKALAKQPQKRFADASELQLALAALPIGVSAQRESSATLTVAMRRLFGPGQPSTMASAAPGYRGVSSLAGGQRAAGRVAPDATQSYAVRDILGGVDDRGRSPSRMPPRISASAPEPQGIGETLALPAMPGPQSARLRESLGGGAVDEFAEEATAVFDPEARRQRPEVPPLRFLTNVNEQLKPMSSPAAAAALPRVGHAVHDTAPARRVRDTEEEPMVPPAADHGATEAAGRKMASGEVEMKGLALGRASPPELDSAASPSGSEAEERTAASFRATNRRRRPPSGGLLSATMRLFVDGLDDLLPPPGAEAEPPAERGIDTAQLEAGLRRTIKPTVLGWLVIGIVISGAALFVLYKRTDLFTHRGDEEAHTLLLDDIKGGANAPAVEGESRGSIVLRADPADAYLFLHKGDAPIEIEIDGGQQQLIRVERDGYRTAHHIVRPGRPSAAKAAIEVVLAPAGAGADPDVPTEFKRGAPSGELRTIRIRSEPPAASVWLLVGRGRVAMTDVPVRRYYFKALRSGHEPAFITVVDSEFADLNGQPLQRSISLDPLVRKRVADAPVDAGLKPAASPRTARPRAALRPKKSQRTRRRASSSTAPRRRSKAKPGRKRSRPKKIVLPDWAR